MGEGGNELEVGGIVDDINRNWSAVLMVETSETAGEKQSIWEVTATMAFFGLLNDWGRLEEDTGMAVPVVERLSR